MFCEKVIDDSNVVPNRLLIILLKQLLCREILRAKPSKLIISIRLKIFVSKPSCDSCRSIQTNLKLLKAGR